MPKQYRGFTLIELIITMAIIGILATIAIPNYQSYASKAANHACLSEIKAYANKALVNFNNNLPIDNPPNGACTEIDKPSTARDTITGKPKKPGTINASCDLSKGAFCLLLS